MPAAPKNDAVDSKGESNASCVYEVKMTKDKGRVVIAIDDIKAGTTLSDFDNTSTLCLTSAIQVK